MSGFRDTFTKEDGKDDLLGYDDTAFYYFACSVLLCVAVPWTFNAVRNILFPGAAEVEKYFPVKNKSGSTFRYCSTSTMVDKVHAARKRARTVTSGSFGLWVLRMVLLAAVWLMLGYYIVQLGNEKGEIKRFDPFDILEVTRESDNKEIKKAYRKLSLIFHPDKNPDDPLAASRFIQITKAYAALTDDAARANYEKYGNPDGPQASKVGIGLPRFLLSKVNHLLILSAFFFALLFIVPMTFICYYQRTKNYAANGVMIETLQFLGYYINESSRVKMCPELLAASAESRGMETRTTDNAQMKEIMQHVVEHKKGQFKVPIIMKNAFLIWAHMQRLHNHLSPELRSDLDELLRYSMKIVQAMIEIACMREWFFTAQAMIEFRRCLVQALDVKSSQLLQIPHFTEETVKHCLKGKNSATTLTDFISSPEQRKGLADMDPQQLADIEAFCSHVSDVEVRATVEVEDEEAIVVGDVATVTIAIHRRNLKEKEAMGPVHAPFFPEPKFEEWWLFLVEAAPATRIITFERVRNTEGHVEEKMRFQLSRPGKHTLVLHALCDAYSGLDQKVELNFNVLAEDEIKREVFVHPEDEDLDLQPTLFQQFMGELNHDEESEEEEDEGSKKKDKKKVDKSDKDLGDANDAAPEDSSDDDEAESTKDSGKENAKKAESTKDSGKENAKKKKGGKDDSSDSSSDSD